jgi:hypothetical protein
MKPLLFISISLILASSCRLRVKCNDVPLSARTAVVGNPLRTDGFYYGNPSADYKGDTGYTIYILYRNGTLILTGHMGNDFEHYISSIASDNSLKQAKSGWGNFRVDDTSIKIENWEPTMCGYPAEFKNGKVINDTTFILYHNQRKDPDGSTVDLAMNQEFHFRRYSIKPDSTNSYIH